MMTRIASSAFLLVLVGSMSMLLSAVSVSAQTVSEGDCICREGIIMDRFCIDRGTLLDNSRVKTLVGPDQHSMHCLLDVSLCVNSGFTVLGDPDVPGGKYSVAAQFDDAGSDLVFDFAAERGRSSSCNDCTGELGDFTRGFRAAVVGIVEDVGIPNSPDPLERAPSIKVTSVIESSDGCARFTCPTVAAPTLASPTSTSIPPPSPVPVPKEPMSSPDLDQTSQVDKVVNCNEFQSVVTLNESPLVTLEFVVNVPNTNSNYEFKNEEVAAGGVMSALLSYDGEGYVALASSTDDFMPNSEAIICLPDDDVPVSKYFLGERSQAAVLPVENSAQTLLNTEIIQADGKTKCLFRKLLNEDGEISIDPNGSNTFIWAVGASNSLSYHRARGVVSIPFEQCTLQGVSEVMALSQGGAYDQYWKAHGILMALAWGFFAPVAIVSAICRRLIPGEGVWFRIHRAANALCCILTIAGFGVAVAAYSGAGIPHFSGTHQRIGVTIFIIVLLQVLNGMLRPHIPKPTSDDVEKGSKTDSDEEEELSYEKKSFKASVVNFSLRRSRAHTPKTEKTVSRFTWEIVHRSIGLALLGMGLYNGYSGLMLYAMRTGNASDYTSVWWGWTGAILGFALLYSIYDRCAVK